MKKYRHLLVYEMKTFFTDPFYLFMFAYPLLMLFICGYLLPAILVHTTLIDSSGYAIPLLISFLLLISIGGFMMGALLGFSFLENKDENTLVNVATSPVTVAGYATFKMVYSYVLAIISNLVMVGGLKIFASDAYRITYGSVSVSLLDQISYGQVLIFACVSSLIVPFVALLLASIAKNKIEGFAMVKMGGLFIMLPMLVLLPGFEGGVQYLLGILPNFWSTKALLNLALQISHPVNLSFAGYLLVGTIYPIFLGWVMLKVFLKRIT